VSAKVRLESEKFDLTELLDKRNREVDRLTGQMPYCASVSDWQIACAWISVSKIWFSSTELRFLTDEIQLVDWVRGWVISNTTFLHAIRRKLQTARSWKLKRAAASLWCPCIFILIFIKIEFLLIYSDIKHHFWHAHILQFKFCLLTRDGEVACSPPLHSTVM